MQREVLAFVLVELPLTVTHDEIALALGSEPAIRAAVAELVESGLLRYDGEEVLPTAAALHSHELEPLEPPRDV